MVGHVQRKLFSKTDLTASWQVVKNAEGYPWRGDWQVETRYANQICNQNTMV